MLEIGIVEDDLRVLAAHFQLDFGLTRNTVDRDLASDAHGAGEADPVHFRVIDDGFTDHAAAAHHQVENTRREASPRDDLGQRPSATRDQVGGFENHAVAIGQGRGNFPGRDGNREVPRSDQTDHAQRFTGDLYMDARAHRRQVIARQAQALTGEKLEDITGAADFTDRFRQGLALFACEQVAQLFLASEDFAADFVQCVAARLNA